MKKLILLTLTVIAVLMIPVTVSALEEVNLSVGKPYTRIAAYVNPTYPDTDNKELTDGFTGSTNFYSSAWTGTYHRHTNSGNTYDEYPLYDVTIDLEGVKSITSVKANFLRHVDAAIYLPWSYKVWASVDGVNWMKLSFLQIKKWNVPTDIYTFGWQVPENACGKGTDYVTTPVKARYVRFVFETYQAHNFIDEITVMGYDGVVSDAVDPYNTEKLEGEIRLADETVGNFHDMVLIYSRDWTTERLKPYLTYVDAEGNSKDTLFDAFCLLKLSSNDGSNLASYKSDMTISDWTEYIAEIFDAEDADVKVLNETAKQASIDLNMPDYKANLVIMIPFPTAQATSFGTLNGRSLDLSVEADWQYLIDWYLEEIETKFNNGNYEYLDFKGFYWVNESPDEQEKITYFTDKVREMGYKSYWIPFFHSVGFFWNEDLGFDAVTLQPSHYFGENSSSSLGGGGTTIIDTVARLGAYGNFGVEMELDYYLSSDLTKYNLFLDYLNSAANMGFQGPGYYRNWYEAGGAIWMLAEDTRPDVRKIYDNVYEVIKGSYKPRKHLTKFYEGNILAGKKYTHNVTNWYSTDSTDVKCKYLTDEILSNSFYSSGYMGVKNQKNFNVTFDFSDDPLTMAEIHTYLFNQPVSAVYLPSNLNIHIKTSANSGWVNVYSGAVPEEISVFKFNRPQKVYGIKFDFTSYGMYTFIKEIMAFEDISNIKSNGDLILPTVIGEFNGDRLVNESDFKILSKYFAGHDVIIDSTAADINGDGEINRADLLRLAKIAINI